MKKPNFNIKASLRTRSFRVGGYSVAATAIVLAIIVAVNVFVGALPSTLTQRDVTANQLFSISEQTEAVVGGLDQDVTVYWIVQSGNEDSTVGLMLNQYEALSDHLVVEEKDPDVYPTFVQQYTDSVYNNSLVVECGDRYRYISYYDIFVYDYSGYYTTGEVTSSFDGESALTSAIDYVVSEDLPKVYVLTGHGESSMASTFSDAVDNENIETEELSLLSENAVPEDADCVMIYALQSDISEEEKDILLSYLQGGGKLLLITGPLQSGELTNLEAVMEYYGVTANEGIVIEGSQSNYAFGTPYYLLPTLKTHSITSALISDGYYILLPVGQGLTVSDELRDGLTVTQLLTTSDSAFSKIAGYDLTTYEKEDGDIDGPFALAVAVTEDVDDDNQTQIVWVSSTALLDESTNQQVSGGNQDFFLNALNWMCDDGDESGLTIHAKSLDNTYLTIPAGTAAILKLFIVGVLPVGFLVVGIYTWVRRRRR